MRSRRRPATRAASLAAAAILALIAAPARASTLPTGFEERTLASGLLGPTAAAFAPDGRIFVAEKFGRVSVVPAGSTTPQTLYQPNDHVNKYSDRGLLGIAVDASFSSNHYLYLLYTWEGSPGSDESLPKTSRLTRVQVNADNTLVNPSSPETVLLGTSTSQPCPAPSNTSDCIPSDSRTHSIGTVRADPDGTLWLGSGDGAPDNAVNDLAFRSYDEQSFAGKIIHIDRNGKGLAGHPFCPSDNNLNHVCTKLYAKGLRNPFRFTLRPGGAGPQIGDVGWSATEEFDLAAPGKNYGWPCYEGSAHTSGYGADSRCPSEYAKEGTAGADTPPDYSYPHVIPPGATYATGAIIGGPTYTGTTVGTGYPAGYLNNVFIGDYALNFIRRLQFGSGGQVTATDVATGPDVTPVDLEIAPSGNVCYVDIAGGNIKEIVYTPGNRTPIARASANPSSGAAPLNVAFKGDTSSDPDGDPLTYDWDFGDGSTHATTANPSHTYAVGNYTARLTVNDGQRSDTTTVGIAAGNTPPTASITAPVDNSSYTDGSTVQLRGSASDAQDVSEPGSRLGWHIVLVHGNHTHILTDLTGTQASFNTFTDHDADSYYTITLTATDAGGLTNSKTVTIRPQTVNVTLASSPTGAPLNYAGLAVTAPWNHVAAIGFQTTISAADQFTSGGRIYGFDHWSDSAGNLHNITVPSADTTYTAVYHDATPTARASGTPSSGPGPLAVTLKGDTSTDVESKPLTYDWDFGDGSTHATTANPSHTYTTRGSYTARLTVTTVRGATDSATVPITVTNAAPVAHASGSPTTGRAPLLVAFKGDTSSDYDGDSITYDWDFGDGGPHSTLANPSHPYLTPGAYTVTLTVNDGHGGSAADIVAVTATNNAPTARASGSPTTGPGPLAVAFKGDTSSDPDLGDTLSYDWDFGDGSTHSPTANPSHTYTTRGTYTARLTVSDGHGGTDNQTVGVTVTNDPPVARATGSPTSGAAPLVVTLKGDTSGDYDGDFLTYDWDFGDGGTSTAANPTHTYSSAGAYSARLTVSDGHGGADSATVSVSVSEPPPTSPPPSADNGPLPDEGTLSSMAQSPDRQGPALSFDERSSSTLRGRLSGQASDPSGVRKVQVALRALRDRRPGCRWWSRGARALRRKRGSCNAPAWMTAVLKPQGNGWSWSLALGTPLPPGAYVLMLRGYDRAGNVAAKMANGRAQTSLRVRPAPAARRR